MRNDWSLRKTQKKKDRKKKKGEQDTSAGGNEKRDADSTEWQTKVSACLKGGSHDPCQRSLREEKEEVSIQRGASNVS